MVGSSTKYISAIIYSQLAFPIDPAIISIIKIPDQSSN